MKKKGAKKAKESDFGSDWNMIRDRRAARFDLNWRASELADNDLWQRRTADFDRGMQPQ